MHCLTIDQLAFERDDTTLFEGLSAQWQSGDLVQIRGHNGVGKTTFLKLIAGILRPSVGRVTFNDFPSGSFDFRASTLYLGHSPAVDSALTSIENLRWYLALHGSGANLAAEDEEAGLLAALKAVGLRGYEDCPLTQMSAGQQRRVSLARLFVSQAPLWILDEPFTSIDAEGVLMLEQRILAHTQAGGLALLTSHQHWSEGDIKQLNVEDFRVGRAGS